MRERLLASVYRSLNIRPGEGLPILLLLAHSLFLGVFVGFYFTVANAAFLGRLDLTRVTRVLPWAYVGSGLVAYAAVAAFSWLRTRTTFRTLLGANLLLVLIVVLVFAGALAVSDAAWIGAAMYVWVIPALALLDLGFWSLAMRLFDLQQGKRLFALVSTGEVLSAAASFFAVPVMGRLGAGPVVLLLVAAAGVALAMALLPVVFRRCQQQLEQCDAPSRSSVEAPGLAGMASNRYLVLLSLVTVFFIVSQYFLDFGFLVELRTQVTDEHTLTSFLGVFFGIAKTAELLLKTLVFSRLTTQLGLLSGLLVLPVAVLVPVALASVRRSLALVPGLMVLLVLAKLLEFTLRKAVYEPSFKVLYQPLAREERLALQTRVEGSVRQIGLLCAGGGLVLITLGSRVSLEPVVLALVFLSLGWIASTILAFREYRARLSEALSRDTGRNLTLAPEEAILQQLRAASAREVGHVLEVLERVEPVLFEAAVIELLGSTDADVRHEALRRAEARRLVAARPALEALAGSEAAGETELARATLRVLDEVEAVAGSPRRLLELSASAVLADRRLAATALAHSSPEVPTEVVLRLMADPDPALRRLAMLAVGRSGRTELVPRLIEELASGEACRAAAAALPLIGEPALPALELAFRRLDSRSDALSRIVDVFERIRSARSDAWLFDQLDHARWQVQRRALLALSTRRFRADESHAPVVRQKIEDVVDRISWYTAALRDLGALGDESLEIRAALEWRAEQDRDSLCLLLALVCDAEAVLQIRDSLARAGEEGRAYALEIASEVITPELRDAVFPILERLTPRQTLDRLDLHFPQAALTPARRLADIISQGPARVAPWTRACAIEALLGTRPSAIPMELAAHATNLHPLVRETTAWAMHNIDADECALRLSALTGDERRALDPVLDSRDRPYLQLERVRILRATEALSQVPAPILASRIAGVEERRLAAGEHLCDQGDPGHSLYVIAEGGIDVEIDGACVARLEPGAVVGEIAVLTDRPRSATLIAAGPSRLIEVDREWIASLLADHLEVAPSLIRTLTARLSRG